MVDPNRWQPLQIEHMISQNGIPVTNGVQQAVGPHWGHVTGFALPAGGATACRSIRVRRRGSAIPPPTRPSRTRRSRSSATAAELDPASGVTIDISPGVRGGNTLGTNDGHGPCGQPGDRSAVRRRTSSTRATSLASWPSSGPTARSPRRRPATGTSIANIVSDELAPNLRIGGDGPAGRSPPMGRQALPRAQRGGPRRRHRGVGPQGPLRLGSADLDDPLHGRAGPVERPDRCRPTTRRACRSFPGSIELVTAETTASGQRHAALAGHEGEIAIRAWTGTPADPKTQIGGVDWILAVDWVPYQLPTFVTPAFPGYVSGHSTFSRAAAEVHDRLHRQRVLPGRAGLRGRPRPAPLKFETGPTRRISASSGRRTTTPRTRPASRACTAASTSRPTTSTGAPSGSAVRQGRLGARAAATTRDTPVVRTALARRRGIRRAVIR